MSSQKYIAVLGHRDQNIKQDDIVEITSQERTPNGKVNFDGDVKGTLPANLFHLVFQKIEPTDLEGMRNRTKIERPLPIPPKPDAYAISPQVNMTLDEYVSRGKSTTVYGPNRFRIQLLQFEEQSFRAFVQSQVNRALREHGIDPNQGAPS